jgi:hypothetical protein
MSKENNMSKSVANKWFVKSVLSAIAIAALLMGCSSERQKNEAKEAAARYWQEKAYPGKAYDVQVLEAEKDENGKYRVKGIVDGETRVGEFSPDSETFSEGYYSLAHEKTKRVAELEEEVKYWKDRSENLEKEMYKLKVRLNLSAGKSTDLDTGDTDNGNVIAPTAKPVSGAVGAAPVIPAKE